MAEMHNRPDDLGVSEPLVTPIYQNSVFTLPDLDALDRIIDGKEPGFIYARDAHPNARRLAARLAELEGANWALITGSGMGALSAIFISTLGKDQRIVASHRLYGRTSQLLSQELARFGVTTTLVDTTDLGQVSRALRTPARVLLVETISNPLLRLADIPRLAELAHENGSLLVVDNTFATPTLARPLELGADFVMESLTKLIGGHGDVTLGVVCGKSELKNEMGQAVSIWGLASNPFDCWLTERGLATLDLRVRTASASAAILADWLAEQRGLARVIYPGRPDHPDHELATHMLAGGFGNMVCFDLSGGRAAVNRFLRRAPGIPFSPSLGDTSTTCSYPATTSHRYVEPEEKRRQGITDGLIRLSVGVEDVHMIQSELAKGLG
jgi:cystathionine beta-lyase/cystathionine gamma-synthase